MFRDRLILAGLAGLAGTCAEEAVYWIPVLAGVVRAKVTTGYYLASIIFAHDSPAAAQILLGELTHLISGGMLGVAVLFLLSWSGRQSVLIKGAALGAVFWLSHVILIPSFVAPRIKIEQSMAGVLLDLVALLAWGAVTAVTLKRLLSLIPDSPDTSQ